MSIKTRIEDTMILYAIERPEAALLCALVAVAATSRRRHPIGTPSVKHPGKKMGDGEAFEGFMKAAMPRICRVVNYNVKYKGSMQPIERIWYKWLRCSLAHEAALPQDIRFESSPAGKIRTAIDPSGTLVLSHGWLDGTVDAVIYAPENEDQFGTPPQPPGPIHLPQLGLYVGTKAPPAPPIP